MTLFSIGHSTHAPDEFARIARGLDVIVDVRSHPTSRWEQWRLENMRIWLPAMGFDVLWMPELGGWTASHYQEHAARMAGVGVDLGAYSKGVFPKQRIGRDRPERCDPDRPAWTNQGLYDYSWFTTTEDFHRGILDLVDAFAGPDKPKAAIMCCEAVYYKCHRSMVADYLWDVHGIDVLHIKGFAPKRPTTRRWINPSDVLGNRIERYPAEVRADWLRAKLATQLAPHV